MSWSCEVCGFGRDADHRLCGIVAELARIADALERLAQVLDTPAQPV